jgi:glyoxylase-like metal-dependent hydrolase (beta-lactamase superfamily II)
MKIAPRIHRLGDRSIVNSYLVEESGEVTIIDAGVPGFYRDIPGELAAMGKTVADVRALVLTHGHTDHIGFAERLRRDQGSRFRSMRWTPLWRAARCRTRRRGSARSSSDR